MKKIICDTVTKVRTYYGSKLWLSQSRQIKIGSGFLRSLVNYKLTKLCFRINRQTWEKDMFNTAFILFSQNLHILNRFIYHNEIQNYNHLVRKRTLANRPVWLNDWVFFYELSGWGSFEFRCCHLNFRYHACFE